MEPKSSKSHRPTETQTLTEEMTSQLPHHNLRCIENKTQTEATNLLTAYLFYGSTRLLLRTRACKPIVNQDPFLFSLPNFLKFPESLVVIQSIHSHIDAVVIGKNLYR